MTTRRRKLALNLAAGALWATTAGVVAAGVWLSVPTVAGPESARRAATRAATSTAPFSFGDLADLDLRKPLVPVEPAAVLPVPVVPPPQALPALTLRGTVVEPGHAYALFATAAGGTELKRVGDRVGPAVVTAILDGSVTVDVAGRPAVLQVPHPPLPVAAGRP